MQIAATRTPVSTEEMGETFLDLVSGLTRDSLRILLAHWASETGWGSKMMNFNVGNSKSAGKSGNWTFFRCSEVVDRATAEKMIAEDSRVTLKKDGGGSKVEIWINPDHPWSCFQAYASLTDGVRAYLGMMKSSFPLSWEKLLQGDVGSFVATLKKERYFTATLAAYQKLFDGVLAMVEDRAPIALASAPLGGDGPLPDPAVPRFH